MLRDLPQERHERCPCGQTKTGRSCSSRKARLPEKLLVQWGRRWHRTALSCATGSRWRGCRRSDGAGDQSADAIFPPPTFTRISPVARWTIARSGDLAASSDSKTVAGRNGRRVFRVIARSLPPAPYGACSGPRFPCKSTNIDTNRDAACTEIRVPSADWPSKWPKPRSAPANVRAITRKTPFVLDKLEVSTQVDAN